MFRTALCLAGLLLSAGSLAADCRAERPLTAQEILRLTPGTFHAIVKGGLAVTVTLTRDGSAVGRLSGHEDRGRWTVRGNEFCIVMPVWTRGRVECSPVVAGDGWFRGRNVVFRKL